MGLCPFFALFSKVLRRLRLRLLTVGPTGARADLRSANAQTPAAAFGGHAFPTGVRSVVRLFHTLRETWLILNTASNHLSILVKRFAQPFHHPALRPVPLPRLLSTFGPFGAGDHGALRTMELHW